MSQVHSPFNSLHLRNEIRCENLNTNYVLERLSSFIWYVMYYIVMYGAQSKLESIKSVTTYRALIYLISTLHNKCFLYLYKTRTKPIKAVVKNRHLHSPTSVHQHKPSKTPTWSIFTERSDIIMKATSVTWGSVIVIYVCWSSHNRTRPPFTDHRPMLSSKLVTSV